MEQHTPQEETRRIISDMMKKRGVFVKPNEDMLACMLRREKRMMKSNSIIPVIGEDTIVCQAAYCFQDVSITPSVRRRTVPSGCLLGIFDGR